MRLFNDYEDYDDSLKVRLCFKRKTSEIMSSWEISNFLSNFSSYYYKLEIIDSVVKALKKGINPQDIFILDESFKLNRTYKKLNHLNLDKEIKELYYIGKPVCIYPNQFIFNINVLFKYFRKYNEYLASIKLKRISTDMLSYFYDLSIDRDIKISLDELHMLITKQVQKKYKDKNFNNIKESYIKEISNYQKDSISLSSVEELLEKPLSNLEEPNDFERLVIAYYDRFFNFLVRIPRPVVCVYFKNKNVIEVNHRGQSPMVVRGKKRVRFIC